MKLIECRNLSFAYEGKTVLSGLSFSVEEGDYLCVVGENGAGKSTLIKGLLNLMKPSEGSISFHGIKADEIGYLPQQMAAQKDFPASVWEVVLSGRLNNIGLSPFYRKQDKLVAEEKMRLLEIENLKKSCFRELSGGQQQRVLLARALCATKRLLLLDEPVTGLDPVMTNELYRVVKELNEKEKITVIMVSHDIHGAVKNAGHILHLDSRSQYFGEKEDYLQTEYARKFLGNGEEGK